MLIENSIADSVDFGKRAHSPLLLAAGFQDTDVSVPCGAAESSKSLSANPVLLGPHPAVDIKARVTDSSHEVMYYVPVFLRRRLGCGIRLRDAGAFGQAPPESAHSLAAREAGVERGLSR